MSVVKIAVPFELRDRCIDYGDAKIEEAKRNPNSRSASVAWGDALTNPDVWTRSKIAECAACLYFELDPVPTLRWGQGTDPGWDFPVQVPGGWPLVDVKETHTKTLFWPIYKNSFFDQEPFHILISATAEIGLSYATIHGWLSKGEFRARRIVSRGLRGEPKEPGTRYVPHERLHRMAIFPGRADDPREHYCWCGDWVAQFDSKVIETLGFWVCHRHAEEALRKWSLTSSSR
jgi:hypothetical protein